MANKKQTLVSRKVIKALHNFSMISSGDRVLIGVSGGKDSTLLLREMHLIQQHLHWDFKLAALYVESELSEPKTRYFLQNICENWEINLHILSINMQERLKAHKKMSCYWCSTQRRTELINFAINNEFNTIALGHHLDDILATITMNWMLKGELEGMAPKVQYKKYPIKLIRPLVYITENEISKYVQALSLAKHSCTCDYNSNSQRKTVRKSLEQLTEGSYTLKNNMLQAVINTAWAHLN
ncbi:MAG: tRNA 2-thiocytidine biosynthesis protein TtcA [Fibrobacter sp.]|nr:tRNA 2-thiocytidine biosynthesis protein TtcA [Fibrobacter sp.]